jgi:hypothetical protein
MSNQLAKDVLIRARNELIRELTASGMAGGIGRSGSYAPNLVNIQGAIDVIDRLEAVEADKVNDKMAKMREARQAKTNEQKVK